MLGIILATSFDFVHQAGSPLFAEISAAHVQKLTAPVFKGLPYYPGYVSEDGSTVWRPDSGVLARYPVNSELTLVQEATRIVPKGSDRKTTLHWGFDTQWSGIILDDYTEIRKKFDTANEQRILFRSVLYAKNRSEGWIWFHLWPGPSQWVVSSCDAESNDWRRNKTKILVQPPLTMVVAAKDRSSDDVCWVETPRRNYGDFKQGPIPAILRWQMGKKSVTSSYSGVIPGLLSDSERKVLALVGIGPTVKLFNSETKRPKTLKLQNPPGGKLFPYYVSWERRGTILIGCYRRMDRGKYDPILKPLLYRFDLETGKFSSLGPYYLYASSLRGDWLIVGEDTGTKRVWLVRTR
ncbi:MAG: hypothetical protein U0R49_07300 [Fimbriimonadales bacterium]